MKKIKNLKLWIAILFTVYLVIGIPSIIFGFAYDMKTVGFIGIFLTVIGFYGTPITWVSYGNFCRLYHLYNLICIDKVYYISLLASTLSQKVEVIEQEVNTLIQKGYLTAFIIVDGKLVNLKEIKDQDDYLASMAGKVRTVTCEGCGYTYTYETTNGMSKCPYCGKKSGK